MSADVPGPAQPPGAPPGDDWADDLWPGEADDDWPEDAPADVPPWPGRGPDDRRRRRRSLSLLIVGVVALAAGAAVALAATSDLLSSSAAPAPSSSPAGEAPGQAGGALPGGAAPGGTVPGGTGPGGTGPGGGAVTQMFVAGKVLAVGATSITVGGPGHTVIAAVTAATRISGRVSGIGSVKVGDMVSAQITQRAGKPVATAIQDPASLPRSAQQP